MIYNLCSCENRMFICVVLIVLKISAVCFSKETYCIIVNTFVLFLFLFVVI